MKEKIKEILSEKEIENVDEVVDEIAKGLATLVIPKDKYNDLSEKLKTANSEKEAIQTELDELKNQNLSDEEKRTKEQADFEKKTKQLSIELNKVKAKEIFKEANIDDEKIEELLGKVVSEDEKTTLDLANSFAEILKNKVEATKKETETDMLDNMAKPNVKTKPNQPKEITKEDFLKMSYSERKDLYFSDKELYEKLTAEDNSNE